MTMIPTTMTILMTILLHCDDIEVDGGEIDLDISKIVDISLREKLVEKEADVLSFSDDSILRGIESDRDSGEDTISIDDLPLDDSYFFFSEFSGFWKLHGSILWKDKAIPTISIDGLQSSLHKVGNLLSLFFIELTSILLA
ncbi:hypothetical protein Tco_0962903 [Tanacetum coccineum]